MLDRYIEEIIHKMVAETMIGLSLGEWLKRYKTKPDYFYIDDINGESLYADENDDNKKRDMQYIKKYTQYTVLDVDFTDNSITIRIDYYER